MIERKKSEGILWIRIVKNPQSIPLDIECNLVNVLRLPGGVVYKCVCACGFIKTVFRVFKRTFDCCTGRCLIYLNVVGENEEKKKIFCI